MGLMILIVVGALLGWLTAIVFKIENGREIGFSIAVAVVGSVVCGLFAAHGSFLAGVSASALLWAALGAVVAVLLLRLVKERVLR